MDTQKYQRLLKNQLTEIREELDYYKQHTQEHEQSKGAENEIGEDYALNTHKAETDSEEGRWHGMHNLTLKALDKIKNGLAYGDCERCGKKIKRARLEAISYAQYCVECQEKHEQVTLEKHD